MLTDCEGNLFDSGGSDNYLHNSSSRITIQPGGNNQVQLNFSVFNYAAGDRVTIYDGPYTSSPIVGVYNGTTLPPAITSSNGAITLKESTNGANNREGFQATWSCLVGMPENVNAVNCIVFPNPTKDKISIQWERGTTEMHFLALFDGLGRLVFQENGLHEGVLVASINVSDLPKGVYSLQVHAGDDRIVKKIIVQ
jgi:hypothetical protein